MEGEIVLRDDGTGTVDDGNVPMTWTIDGTTVTLEVQGRQAEAELRDDELVFEPGLYSCCEDTEAVFVRTP
jgi:hypothetical protein